MVFVSEPFPVFYDTDGTPLDDGMIYVGQINQDARANPLQLYSDVALTQTLAQPVRTLNGRPAYQGAPINVYTATGSYSLEVQNRFGTPVLTVANGTSPIFSFFGLQSRGQVSIGTNTTVSLEAHGGTVSLATVAGITITFPASGFPDGSIIALSNVSSGSVNLIFPGGSDASSILPSGGSIFLHSDGTGYWRGLFDNSLGDPVSTLAELAALDTNYTSAILTDPLRGGVWYRAATSANTALLAADTFNGLSITSTFNAAFCWLRQWDGVNGRPEWFGAEPNNSGVNAALNINACIALCPTTQLQAADYWVSTTIKLNKSNRVLRGAGQDYVSAAGEATRILTTSATLTLVQVGADSFPGSVNDYLRGMIAQDFYVGRTTGPDKTSKPVGVLMQFCLGGELLRIKSVDSTYSFRISGVVASYVRRCNANRVVAGTGSGTDEWTGYLLDGTPNIGLAGGNASLYIVETQAGCNISSLQTGISYGYRTIGKPQDLFMDKPESVSCNIGISIESTGSGDADLKIDTPIMDAPFKWGIYAAGLSEQSTLNIINPYAGFNSSTQFGIYFNACEGAANVIGGDLLSAGHAGVGIGIIDCVGVSVQKTILKEMGGIGVGTGGTCANLNIETVHHNPTVTGAAAVQLNGTATNASTVAPTVYGKASGFTFGIQVVGAIDARNGYSMTGVDSGTISGGSANKLVRNGVQITATGLSGTNFVDGVMT